jgi:hypothetical protein
MILVAKAVSEETVSPIRRVLAPGGSISEAHGRIGSQYACICAGQGPQRLVPGEMRSMSTRMNAKSLAILTVGLCFVGAARAQQESSSAPTTSTRLAPSPAQSIDMFVFPRNNQSAEQQLTDEKECFAAAKERTGVDVTANPFEGLNEVEMIAAQQQAAAEADRARGGRARGGLRGAAGGAAIGAIAGNAGTGAATGAVAGTMQGGMAQRSANARAQQQSAAQVAATQRRMQEQLLIAHMQGVDAFQRAFSACMDARNYSVH